MVALRIERERDDREAARDAGRRVRRRAKRRKLGDGDLVRALDLTSDELTGLAQDRIRRIVAAIVSDEGKLSLCEKVLAKVPRGWEKAETSVEDEAAEREAAE